MKGTLIRKVRRLLIQFQTQHEQNDYPQQNLSTQPQKNTKK